MKQSVKALHASVRIIVQDSLQNSTVFLGHYGIRRVDSSIWKAPDLVYCIYIYIYILFFKHLPPHPSITWLVPRSFPCSVFSPVVCASEYTPCNPEAVWYVAIHEVLSCTTSNSDQEKSWAHSLARSVKYLWDYETVVLHVVFFFFVASCKPGTSSTQHSRMRRW